MANFANIVAAINAAITANDNQEITGPVLNAVLQDMVNSMGKAGYQFKGVASTSTNPGTPDNNVFYVAGPGTYSYFTGPTVDEGYIAFFRYNGTWTIERVLVASDLLVECPFSIHARVNSTGSFINTEDARRTDYIEVVTGAKIVAYDSGTSNAYRACNFYDKNKQWISCLSFPSAGLKTIVLTADNIPAGAKYFVSCTLTSMLDESYVFYSRLNKLEDEAAAISLKMGDMETMLEDYNTLPAASISRSVSVDSGARLDTTFDMRNYVGQVAEVIVTRTGGSSTEFAIYNGGNDYWVGSAFNYNSAVSFVINSDITSLRVMGMATEGSSATFSISITIKQRMGLSRLGNKTIYKSVPYSFESGYYINGNNGTMPNSHTALEGAGSTSGTISPGDSLVIKGTGTSKIICLFAFYNSSKSRIQLAAAGNTNGLSELEVIAPENAAYFVCNTYPYSSQNDRVEVRKNYTIEQLKDGIAALQVASAEERADIDTFLWKGKTVVCFGDSITELANSAEKTYPDYIAEITGATVVNVGVGGTRLACRTTPVSNPANAQQGYAALDCANLVDAAATQDFTTVDAGALYLKNNESDDNTPIVARLKAVNWANVAAVTFFIGTNDWGGSQNYGSTGTSSKNTVLGAVNFIIATLLTAYPHLKIYWFTPCVRWLASSLAQRTDANWGGVATRDGRTLEQFADGVEAEVEKNSIPVCDMYHTLGWNKSNFSQYFNDSDGTHPLKGFPEIARRIVSFVRSCQTF